MSTPFTPLQAKRGDTFRRKIRLVNPPADDGTPGGPTNLADCTLTLHLREPEADAPVLSVPLTIDDISNGLASVKLSAAQTSALVAGVQYMYEVEQFDGAGDTSTVVQGTFSVEKDIG